MPSETTPCVSTSAQPTPLSVALLAQPDVHRPARKAYTHAHASMLFHVNGRSRIEQQGEWDVQAGDVLLIPAGLAHRCLDRRDAEIWGVSFCVPCFREHEPAAGFDALERVRDGAAAVVSIPGERQEFLVSLLREMQSLDRDRFVGEARMRIERSLLTLVMREIDIAADRVPSTRTTAPGVVANALRFIERNALRRVSLDEIAHAVGRSPAYVTTALTRSTGRSAMEWITSHRLAEACRWLEHSNESIDAVAARVGYLDATHFIRMFRRGLGKTPAAWRTQVRSARSPRVPPSTRD